MTIGQKIKNLRETKEMTQQVLADKSKLSRVSIGNYERGDRIPTTETALKISQALGVSINRITDNELHEYLKDLIARTDIPVELLFDEKKMDLQIIEDIENGIIPERKILVKIAECFGDWLEMLTHYEEEYIEDIKKELLTRGGYASYLNESEKNKIKEILNKTAETSTETTKKKKITLKELLFEYADSMEILVNDKPLKRKDKEKLVEMANVMFNKPE